MLAGQRWAIAVIFIAQLLLLPTIWPRAFFGGVELWPGRIAALASLMMIVPGLLSARRAAAAMVLITGWREPSSRAAACSTRSRRSRLLAALLPLF